MSSTATSLVDLEQKLTAGEPFTRADAERMIGCRDLVTVGMLGETARKALSWRARDVRPGLADSAGDALPAAPVDAGEVRISSSAAASVDGMRAQVHAAAAIAGGVPLTGFSLSDLLELARRRSPGARRSGACAAGGRDSTPSPKFRSIGLGDTENAIEVVRAVMHGGLGGLARHGRRARRCRSARPDRAGGRDSARDRRAAGVRAAAASGSRRDAVDRLRRRPDDSGGASWSARSPRIQVDWPLYGPKLAQVAIAYGADDIDGVAADGRPAARAPAIAARGHRTADPRRVRGAGRAQRPIRAARVTRPVRLGAVSYLNVRPLVYGLDCIPTW